MRKHLCAVALTLLIVGAARVYSEDDSPKRLAQQSVGGIDAKGSGTIKGIVRFKGDKPQAKPIAEIAGNAFCKQCYKDEIPLQDSFVFGKNGDHDTLQNVLVYVSKGLEGKHFDPPANAVVLDQVGCMYTPHVVAVMVGQTLDIRNSDATLHNVMSAPRNNPSFNFGMPVQGGHTEKVFRDPEFKMNFRCFMHPWMSSYVHVLPHPFFAITGPDGTFTIRALPPGEYVVTVLHETSLFTPEPAEANVKIGPNDTKQIDFTYRPKGEAK
jgi:plastocyanin